MRTRVLKSVTAAQERLDMRSGYHTTKILPVGVRGTKNVWCLRSLVRSQPRGVFYLGGNHFTLKGGGGGLVL